MNASAFPTILSRCWRRLLEPVWLCRSGSSAGVDMSRPFRSTSGERGRFLGDATPPRRSDRCLTMSEAPARASPETTPRRNSCGALQTFGPLAANEPLRPSPESDLMCRVIELLPLKPAQITHRLTFLARVSTAVLDHEGAHLLLVDSPCLNRCHSSANEISHSSVTFTRTPYRRQFAALQPYARIPWDQRWHHHGAFVAERPDQAIKTIASWASLVTGSGCGQTGRRFILRSAHVGGRSIELTERTERSFPGPRPESRPHSFAWHQFR